MLARQLDLLARPRDGAEKVSFDAQLAASTRIVLGQGAWVDRVPGWVRGHDRLFERLEQGTRWTTQRRVMYERTVDVPRLLARLPDDGPGAPILGDMARVLGRRYATRLTTIHLALYRDGRDSVAWHGDRVGRERSHTVVAIVSLGGARRFLLRPAGGGPSRAISVGCGDLMVLGGSCQRTWEHCVPKCARAEPRIAVMFREAYTSAR